MIFNKSDKQVRWIIGGSSGIGYELAKRYLQAGDKPQPWQWCPTILLKHIINLNI